MGYIEDLRTHIAQKFNDNNMEIEAMKKNLDLMVEEQRVLSRMLSAIGGEEAKGAEQDHAKIREGSLEDFVWKALMSNVDISKIKYHRDVIHSISKELTEHGVEHTGAQIADTLWRLVRKNKIAPWWARTPRKTKEHGAEAVPEAPVNTGSNGIGVRDQEQEQEDPEGKEWRDLVSTKVQGTMVFEGAERHPDLK